ncbi:MAG: hypothetical protein JOY85_20360, partial [Acidobacteriaceae bacterium]|nr:hypothetical protein [Acidobacteriaceae bacterium]
IIRNFYFTEAAFIQFKAELLNAFNRHIFAVSGAPTGPNDARFGVIGGTINAQRVVQFTLRFSF